MGWSFNTQAGGLKEEIRRLTTIAGYNDVSLPDGAVVRTRCLTKQFRGNVRFQGNLWTLWERTWTRPDGSEAKPPHRFIILFLMRCEARCWGYKDIDESMGPCEVNCPISYIERATEPVNEYARAWRERVRATYKAGPGRKLVVGTTYRLRPNSSKATRATLTSLKPLKGTINGYEYRLTNKLILDPIPNDETAQALVSCIEDNPKDVFAKGVYADWLDEHGWPELAATYREAVTVRNIETKQLATTE